MILTRVMVKFFYPSYLQTANVLYAFYCHNGSFSQPEGKPRAALSTSGNVAKKSIHLIKHIVVWGYNVKEVLDDAHIKVHFQRIRWQGNPRT